MYLSYTIKIRAGWWAWVASAVRLSGRRRSLWCLGMPPIVLLELVSARRTWGVISIDIFSIKLEDLSRFSHTVQPKSPIGLGVDFMRPAVGGV